MKIGACAAILLAAASSALAQDSGTWSTVAPMSTPRFRQALVRLPNGHVLMIGGNGGNLGWNLPTQVFDPVAGSWALKAAIPRGSEGHFAGLLPDGRVLVAGGRVTGTPRDGCYLYTPATDSWAPTASLPAAFAAKFGAGYTDAGTMLANGHPLLARYEVVIEYLPSTGTWVRRADCPFAKTELDLKTLPDGRVLATASSFGEYAVYSPAQNAWTLHAGTPVFTGAWPATTLMKGGRLLVADGPNAGTSQEYDAAADAWSLPAAFPETRDFWPKAVTLLDGTVLVTTGSSTAAFGTRYNPDTGAWTDQAHATPSRVSAAVIRLGSGKVLVCGGHDGWNLYDRCDLYTPDNAASYAEPVVEIASSELNVPAGVPISFSPGNSHDPDGGTLTYHWEFSDGSDANVASAVHAFPAAGTYDVGLLVTDDEGIQASAVVTVTVTAAPSTYAQWRALHFTAAEANDLAISGEAADPDGDGVPNLQEYAFAMDPRVNSRFGIPSVSIVDWRLTLSFNQYTASTDLEFDVYAATQVTGPWMTGPSVVEESSRTATGPVSRVGVRYVPDIRTTSAGFLKLRIVRLASYVYGFWPVEPGQGSSPLADPVAPADDASPHGRCGSIGVDLLLLPLAIWAMKRRGSR